MLKNDTIAAIATPAGNGAVGIIRLSGPDAIPVFTKVWAGKVPPGQFEPRRVYLGGIVHPKGGSWNQPNQHHRCVEGEAPAALPTEGATRAPVIDRVVVFLMRAPSSYTGEDVVEVQGHGGWRVMEMLLEAFFLAGARPAEPGEFSRRAFLNGRMDLAQAEAVADLIQAGSSRAVELAERQLEGGLSECVGQLRAELKVMRAQMEASIDFPEDEDVQGLHNDEVCQRLDDISRRIAGLIETYEEGRSIREGIRVAIAGKPNSGKSSLFNALLKEDRAIVHASPGTTRDVLEETLDLKGLAVRFIDTAGIRVGRDAIESEGIRRARERLFHADLVLVVLDSSRSLNEEDEMVFEMVSGRPALVLYNKIDLPPAFVRSDAMPISAKHERGIDEIKGAIVARFLKNPTSNGGSEVMITNLRHRIALQKGLEALGRVKEASEGGRSLEFLVADLSIAMNFLGEVTGEVTNEEILGEIFSRFCIGK